LPWAASAVTAMTAMTAMPWHVRHAGVQNMSLWGTSPESRLIPRISSTSNRRPIPVRIRRIRGGKVKVLEQRKHSHASRQSVSLASYVESEIEAF